MQFVSPTPPPEVGQHRPYISVTSVRTMSDASSAAFSRPKVPFCCTYSRSRQSREACRQTLHRSSQHGNFKNLGSEHMPFPPFMMTHIFDPTHLSMSSTRLVSQAGPRNAGYRIVSLTQGKKRFGGHCELKVMGIRRRSSLPTRVPGYREFGTLRFRLMFTISWHSARFLRMP